MPESRRPIAPLLFAGILCLSGWAVAIGLGLRLREQERHVPLLPPAVPVIANQQKEPAENPAARLFREFCAHPEMAGAAVAFCLLDEKGKTLFASPLAEIALSPASSLKTVTTGAALDILGPEFRFETLLTSTAAIGPDGVLKGDLILVGSGDPTLSAEDLAALAEAAVAAGLKTVQGQVKVDTSIFSDDPVSDHWVWGDLGNAYGAGAYGMNVDHNRLTVRFEPAKEPGGPAKLLDYSEVPRDTEWKNFVETGPPGSGDEVVIYSAPYGRTITLRGTVPAGESGFSVSAAQPNPPALAAQILRSRLEAAGVKFVAETPRPGTVAKPTTAPKPVVLARHASPPLPEIIDHLHRVSDNLEAQCLFLTIGHRLQADPATAIRAHWEKAGVSFTALRLIDGSGLARANMIRPIDLARVNYTARHAANGQRFFQSLSTYVNGNVRAKIGGMSGVKTQVGFLRGKNDRELTFAVMGNGLAPGREFWARLEKMLAEVATLEF